MHRLNGSQNDFSSGATERSHDEEVALLTKSLEQFHEVHAAAMHEEIAHDGSSADDVHSATTKTALFGAALVYQVRSDGHERCLATAFIGSRCHHDCYSPPLPHYHPP